MGIHSKILVHWTGRDIEKAGCTDKPQQYVARLRDDLKYGLYATPVVEAAIRKVKVKRLVRICFTEIRLSEAQTHAGRYGKLGIGFARKFVMDRGGRPVIYIPFSPQPDGSLLEDSIRYFYENRDEEDLEARSAVTRILGYVKRMDDPGDELHDGPDCFYEEMEWRLVYGKGANDKYFVAGEEPEIYRCPFAARDVKVIVFPDELTKQLALGDAFINKYFSAETPIIATLDDCSNF